MLYDIQPDERIFTVTKSYLNHEMDRGAKQAGVKKIRVHDIRHSAVSLLINMGFSVLAIGERMGHEAEKITYRYAHLFPNGADANGGETGNGENDKGEHKWKEHLITKGDGAIDTVAFRVSDEEAKLINDLVALSGLTKQDYITRRLLCRDVVVQGNPRGV